MSNMSYCRFENTSRDVEDCIRAIERGEIFELCPYELSALKNLKDQALYLVEMIDTIHKGIKESEKFNR